jgi:hypothetical protein
MSVKKINITFLKKGWLLISSLMHPLNIDTRTKYKPNFFNLWRLIIRICIPNLQFL